MFKLCRKLFLCITLSVMIFLSSGNANAQYPFGYVRAAMKCSGAKVGAQPQDKWIFPFDGDKIAVINRQGQFFYHSVGFGNQGCFIAEGKFVPGSPIAARPEDEFVAATRDYVLVFPNGSNAGNIFVHRVGESVGAGKYLGKYPQNSARKWIVTTPDHNNITFITPQGAVFWNNVYNKGGIFPNWNKNTPLPGPKVGSNSQDRWVFELRENLFVITKKGDVFIHPYQQLTSPDGFVGNAYQLQSPQKVAVNPQDRAVFGMNGNSSDHSSGIFVVTTSGEVFVHVIQ